LLPKPSAFNLAAKPGEVLRIADAGGWWERDGDGREEALAVEKVVALEMELLRGDAVGGWSRSLMRLSWARDASLMGVEEDAATREGDGLRSEVAGVVVSEAMGVLGCPRASSWDKGPVVGALGLLAESLPDGEAAPAFLLEHRREESSCSCNCETLAGPWENPIDNSKLPLLLALRD
jgi:hypothetical protein